jgi:two-component system sensor histidine kinase/response regulator
MARVLLIDDDAALREVQAELLSAAGHQTMQAATGVAVILGGSEMLRDLHQEMTPKEIGEMATTISKAAQRLHRMAENYLLHVGMELERLTVAESPARALSGTAGADLVRDAAYAQAREYGREGDLQTALADTTLPLAEPYVRKAVSELVDNALKFSEAGTPIKVSLTAPGGRVALSVGDAGRGMTLDQIREVGAFHQFNRAVLEQQGSGLGLILVKGIIEASGGTFDIRSAMGEGTTVSATWSA